MTIIKRMKLLRPTLCAAAALICLLMPATASAEWGFKCSLHNHCYGLADWAMSGSGGGGGEEVMGLATEIVTEAMNVPHWEEGNFVTNEQWMRARGGNWMEDGQIAGHPSATEEGREVNGDSLHWFYAGNNGASEGQNWYFEYIAPWTYPGWTAEEYTVSDPERNGDWCAKINAVQVNCHDNYSAYATDVEMGMEAASEEQPENLGYDVSTGVENTSGEWEHWHSAEWTTDNEHLISEEGWTCAKGYYDIAAYISFGTPANKCFS